MKKQLRIDKWNGYKKLLMAFLLTIFISQAQAQNVQIKGKVTGSDGAGIPGASVLIKGTTKATSTDPNGNYTISAASNAILVISYISYTTKEVAVAGKTIINVTLSSDVKTLDQVVVIGYGSVKRKDLTGSVSSVSADQIEKVPVTTLDQALQGRSAGVQITNNDGSPGAGIQVQIRGVGSFGDNSPLYVVDGYPITGGLNTINPNDVASIDILKDASATAIYGNRAANGVVIITTKRGKIGQVKVSVDAVGSVQSEPKKYDVLDAQQFATLAASRATIDGFLNRPEWANPAAIQNVNWQDVMYQTGSRQNYNVAIRGGSEKLQSALSIGYLDQTGIVKEAYFKRVNASLNSDYTPFKWLKGSANLKYTRGNNKVPFGTGGQNSGLGIGSLTKLIPNLPGNPANGFAKDANGNYGFYDPTDLTTNYLANPLYAVETQDQKNLTNYFLGNVSLEATILPGLKIKTNYGINTNDYSGYYFTPADSRTTAYGGNTSLSYYSQSANNTFEYLWENTLSYTKTFGDHSIDFVGGISQQETTYRQIGAQGNGSISNQLRDLGSVTTITSVTGNEQTYALASQFARLNYKYKDKYLITGTVRRDGSSKFAKDHQYGVFPSVSAAWRVKSEDFLKDVDAISDLKFRVGYGEVGNQGGIGLFKYLSQYSTGGSVLSADNVGYPFGGVYQPGIVLAALPNPNLKWETSRQTDIGLDAGFLGGKINLTVDYYSKESKDFLLPVPVPPQTGYTRADRNVGAIKNSGFEFSAEYRESAKPFKYGINLNVTTVNNKLLSLATGQDAITNLSGLGFPNVGGNTWVTFSNSRIGGPVGEFYGFRSDGIFQSQAEIDALNAKAGAGSFYQFEKTVPGDRKFKDLNGDGKVTDADREALGSPIPTLFSGLTLDASYKNFDVNLFFYASVGGKIFNYAARTQETFGATQGGIGIENVGTEYYLNSWTPDRPSNRYARVTKADLNGNTRPSDVYVENGDYLRLRNMQIGYTLPSLISSKFAVSRARIYVSAQNLFTITKYSGLDPEIGLPAGDNGARNVTAAGVDVGTYPSSRLYTLGLNVTF
ncbi:TonB-linked SusC/RagA family outer membrane protein [Pedobacter sp. UYP30]|uniref:SusC/RagA family TonB-linked outer membrane protein n=1 Tax=Pedobacter sp. UYP30 TaxID=1756400 RepID=UPI0033991B85